MTNKRPPLPARWEYLALSAASLLVIAAVQMKSRHPDSSLPQVTNPHVRAWLDSTRAEDAQNPWRAQLNLERNVLRGLTGLYLAWRAYRFERAARQAGM